MYKLLRDSHLALGLFFFTFILMFGTSSLRFAHPDWISAEPTAKTTATLTIEGVSDARSLARNLMEEHGLRGNFYDLRETEEGFRFSISSMGTANNVSYLRALDRVEIETLERPLISVLLGMHMTFGFGHENWANELFAAFNLLTSVALLVLGATGIYLWFKIHKERLVGSIILAGSLVTLGGLILSIRFA